MLVFPEGGKRENPGNKIPGRQREQSKPNPDMTWGQGLESRVQRWETSAFIHARSQLQLSFYPFLDYRHYQPAISACHTFSMVFHRRHQYRLISMDSQHIDPIPPKTPCSMSWSLTNQLDLHRCLQSALYSLGSTTVKIVSDIWNDKNCLEESRIVGILKINQTTRLLVKRSSCSTSAR